MYINTYLPEYPFSPKATFRLLKKLDSVFASLLTGEDADSGAPLPGFESRRNVVSMTEKVRIKSIAETCRVAVVEAREQVDRPDDEDDLSDDDDDMDDVFSTDDYTAPGRWEFTRRRFNYLEMSWGKRENSVTRTWLPEMLARLSRVSEDSDNNNQAKQHSALGS